MTSAVPTHRRWWRIALLMLAALVLLLVLAYFALQRVFPPQRLAALLADEVRAATGREFRIGGELSLRLLPTIAVVAKDVSLGNASWGTRPQMATIQRAAFEVAVSPLLRGELHVLSVDVGGADVLLETDPRGRSNWIFGDSAKPTTESPKTMAAPIDLDRIAIADSRIAYRSGLTHDTHAVAIESLTLLNQDGQIALSAQLAGEHRAWRLSGKTAPYEALLSGRAPWPFELQVAAEGAKLTAHGSLDADGAVTTMLTARIEQASALTPLVAGAAALPMPIEVSATVRRNASALTADVQRLSVAGQTLAGKATLRGDRAEPRLELEVAAPSIDLAAWGLSKPAPGPRAAGQPLFGDTPLPTIALPATRLRASVRVDRLAAPGLPPLAGVKARLQVEPDRLLIDPLSFELASGSVQGGIELISHHGEPPRVRLRADAHALSMQALEAWQSGAGHVRGGRADLHVNLDAAGRTPRELAASVSGRARLSVADAALLGGAAVMERNIVVALLQALLPKQAGTDRSLQIQCAVVNLLLSRGVAAIERSIAIETDKVAVAASGEFNLAAQTVALGFHPVAKKGIGLDSANLAKLVRLEGPLQDPKIAIDMVGTAREAANIGAAVATAGLSLVGKRLLSAPEDTQVCQRALGGASP